MKELTVVDAPTARPNQYQRPVAMKSTSFLPRKSKFALGVIALLACCLPASAWAMPAGLEEKVADVMVWVIIIVLPVVALYLFWKVHVLPEVFAEKNHHPQKHAIQVLCLLSLMVGGLLWPLAWLWAFTKPTSYKMAYGTDKHDDFFLKPEGGHADKPLDLAIVDDELMLLKERTDGLKKKRELILSSQPPAPVQPAKSEGQKNA